MTIRTQLTKDGSSTLFSDKHNEHFHSVNGAIQESMHVFIDAGLRHVMFDRPISLLEVGFGSGLNALLTILNCGAVEIDYVGIDCEPLENDTISALNYPEILPDAKAYDAFIKIHMQPWGRRADIYENFRLMKVRNDLQQVTFAQKFDLVYFDAFSPNKQPELWTKELFSKIFSVCNPGAALVTYSAKGEVRRNLTKAGFSVERLPGPQGKRHMLRAVKQS